MSWSLVDRDSKATRCTAASDQLDRLYAMPYGMSWQTMFLPMTSPGREALCMRLADAVSASCSR